MPPDVDLVVVFRCFESASISKQQTLDGARKAKFQYRKLLDTLLHGGLHAVGRRGGKEGHLLIFVSCPPARLCRLAQRERHSDFLYGLPSSTIPSTASDLSAAPTTPAERIRLVHEYITAAPTEGGLGITPGTAAWDLVESVMALHDHAFNETWLKVWTTSTSQMWTVDVDGIREQFGDAVALYFFFLSFYTRSLLIPASLGLLSHFFLPPNSPLYSFFLLLWSTFFVEWWRVHERILAVRWGTRGAFYVEKRRALFKAHASQRAWWKRDARVLASVPVILGFSGVLGVLLTGIFVLEAFVTHLYTGPGSRFVSFAPTVLFVALVTPLTAVYQRYAQRFTAWENHAHQSKHDASLALKTFALSAVVSYLGLALSAFVYVPFGTQIMSSVQTNLFRGLDTGPALDALGGKHGIGKKWWDVDEHGVRSKLNASRLQEQMFAYTVTDQVMNTFVEVGLPYILRFVNSVRSGKLGKRGSGGKKKKIVFDREEEDDNEEREFLERVRSEVALPEYELFGDYSEMVTQFGYVVLWSTIWPLAPVMALVNNFFELRSDAFKIITHQRRPVPVRTDTIGPWLDALSFLSWLAALTNAALVYLFRSHSHETSTVVLTHSGGVDARLLLAVAGVVALGASHGHAALRRVMEHVVEHVVWRGNGEVREAERREREVKERYLRSVGAGAAGEEGASDGQADPERKGSAFWTREEGLEEIEKMGKDA